MASFYPLKVKKIQRETADSVSIALEIPEDLRNVFHFTPGQYLTFKKQFGGSEIRRSYSISSTPMDSELSVGVKRVEGGLFSTYATRELKVGDTLETLAPHGRFTVPIDAKKAQTYVGFAAGSGITPIISIFETVLRTEPQSRVVLFFGNRHKRSIIYRRRLDALKNEFLGRFSLYHIFSGEEQDAALFNGRIDEQKCDQFTEFLIDPILVDHYLLCGPEQMIASVRKVLANKGVDAEKVHFELFTSNPVEGEMVALEQVKTIDDSATAMSQVTVVLDGHEFYLEMPQTGKTILDAAADAGVDVPYSCKGAVCCTCMAKVTEGQVHMTKNYSLTDGEVAKGLVLTCQAHPRSANVVVNFDEI